MTIPLSFSPSFPQEESNSLYISDGGPVRRLSFTHPRLHVVLICPDQNIGHIEEDYIYSDVAKMMDKLPLLYCSGLLHVLFGSNSLITYIGLFTYITMQRSVQCVCTSFALYPVN